MKVFDGLLTRVSEDTGSWFNTLRTGELARPRGGMICPAAEGGGNFHDGKSVTLDCLDVALPFTQKLAEDLRSGTSFIGKLSALVARLPIPRGGVRCLDGGLSSELFSMSAYSWDIGLYVVFDTSQSIAPSSSRESFLRTVASLEEPETSRMSESSRTGFREETLRGRCRTFRFAVVRGDPRNFTCSVLAR